MIRVFIQSAIPGYYRQHGLNSRHLFLTVLRLGILRMPVDSVSGERPLLGLQWGCGGWAREPLLLVSSHGRELQPLLSFQKCTDPIMRTPPTCPYQNLITPKCPASIYHPSGVQGFNIQIFFLRGRGYKYAVHNSIILLFSHQNLEFSNSRSVNVLNYI